MKPIKVASIGAGWVCTHRHLPVMDKSDLFEVVGIIDRHPGHAQKVASERGYAHFTETDNLANVDWLDQVDAISVSTAPMTHYEHIKYALENGKHVITEKPFTSNLAQAQELINLAREKKLHLGIVHNFQFARSMKRLLVDIDAGMYGKVLSINATQWGNPKRRLPQWYEELPLGLFYDESPHLLYLVHRLAGDIELKRVTGAPSVSGLNTPAFIDIHFKSESNNIPVNIRCNFETTISEWHLCVFGEKYMGMVDIFRDIYIRLPNDEQHDTKTVIRTSFLTTFQHWYQHFVSGWKHLSGSLYYGNEEIFQRFAQAINGDVSALEPVNAEKAYAILELQHKIIDEYKELW